MLATFESSAFEFLFPYLDKDPHPNVVDVDLLMEPTKDFPGIISPKVYSNHILCLINIINHNFK